MLINNNNNKFNPVLIRFLSLSMSLWNTNLMAGGNFMANVCIKCGIFQGDCLSPLLFCLALNPLSELIKDTSCGYKLKCNVLVQHLLYMDDLKLYDKNEKEIDLLLRTVLIFCEDVSMRINVVKSAVLIMSRGKVVQTNGLDLPNLGTLSTIETGAGYKYLGVLQDVAIQQEKVETKVINEFYRRIRKVLSSKLHGRFKFLALNAYALPVISYTGGVVSWKDSELDTIDRRVRKLLTMNKGLHPRSDVTRLYLPRKDGSRGLKNVKNTIKIKQFSLSHYTWANLQQEPLLKAVQVSGLFPKPTISLSEFKSTK